jgi:hypothetical protein
VVENRDVIFIVMVGFIVEQSKIFPDASTGSAKSIDNVGSVWILAGYEIHVFLKN